MENIVIAMRRILRSSRLRVNRIVNRVTGIIARQPKVIRKVLLHRVPRLIGLYSVNLHWRFYAVR